MVMLILRPLCQQLPSVDCKVLHHIFWLEVVGDAQEPRDLFHGVAVGDVEEYRGRRLLHLKEEFVELGLFLHLGRGCVLFPGQESAFD